MVSEKIFTRNFILAFLSQFAFACSLSMLIPTLPIYLSGLGSREDEIGALIGIFSISSLVLRPSVGKLLPRIGERRAMIAGSFLNSLMSAVYLFALPFWPFFLVRVIQGVGFALFSTAAFTLIANIGPEARLGQTFSYFYLSLNIPFALAPAFGVFLMNRYGFVPLFLACAGFYLFSLLAISTLSKREVNPLAGVSLPSDAFISRENLPPSIVSCLLHMIFGTVTTFLPLFALDHGVSNPGMVFSVFAFTVIVGRISGGRILDRHRRESVILPCLVIYTISMVILVFSTTLLMFIMGALIWGLGHALLFPALVTLAIERGNSSRGSLMAMFTAAGDFGMGVGPVIMGIILQYTSYPIMFLSLVFMGMINLAYFSLFVRKKEGNLA